MSNKEKTEDGTRRAALDRAVSMFNASEAEVVERRVSRPVESEDTPGLYFDSAKAAAKYTELLERNGRINRWTIGVAVLFVTIGLGLMINIAYSANSITDHDRARIKQLDAQVKETQAEIDLFKGQVLKSKKLMDDALVAILNANAAEPSRADQTKLLKDIRDQLTKNENDSEHFVNELEHKLHASNTN